MATSNPLALSIFNAEGGENSAGFQLNNPGDIMSGGSLNAYPTLQDGFNALESQLSAYLNGTSAYANGDTSLSDLANTYTGGDNASSWASAVAQNLGVDPSDSISTAANASPSSSLLAKLGQYFNGSAGSSPSSSSGGVVGAAKNALSSVAGGTINAVFSDLFSSRVAIGAVGLLFIAGGLFTFKGVQQTVIETGKKAARVAAESVA